MATHDVADAFGELQSNVPNRLPGGPASSRTGAAHGSGPAARPHVSGQLPCCDDAAPAGLEIPTEARGMPARDPASAGSHQGGSCVWFLFLVSIRLFFFGDYLFGCLETKS